MLVYAVEDELSIQELYKYSLTSAGMDVACFNGGVDFFVAIKTKLPDIILLDIMMEGMSGYDILRILKNDERYTDIPVILISAKGEEQSKVKGLDMGADDYIAKPFGLKELVARIKVNTRHIVKQSGVKEYKDIIADRNVRIITIGGEKVECTQKVFDLMYYLLKNANCVVTKEELASKIWNDEFIIESRTLDVHINEVRKKLTKFGSVVGIKTVRGVGYILE